MTESAIQTQRDGYIKQMQTNQKDLQEAQQKVAEITAHLHRLNGAVVALDELKKGAADLAASSVALAAPVAPAVAPVTPATK